MKLYHYSKDKYKDIRSQVAQGAMESTNDDRQYGKSVSLFLERLPLTVAEIFNNTHQFYRSSLELWEYEVDTSDIPIDIIYTLTETPEKTALLYGSQKWYEGMSAELIQSNKKEIDDMEIAKGYQSKGRIALVKACKSVPKGIEQYFEKTAKLAKKFPEDGLDKKYAASVPHLMIYPNDKPIPYRNVKMITLR